MVAAYIKEEQDIPVSARWRNSSQRRNDSLPTHHHPTNLTSHHTDTTNGRNSDIKY